MRITYLANIRLPTEKAHGIQIMKMCAAFKNAGHNIELVLPWRKNFIEDDPFEYYSISTRFPIRRIFSLDLVKYGRFGFSLQSLTFAISAFFFTLFHGADIVFGRDELPTLFASVHSKTIWETHTGSYTPTVRALLLTKTKIIAISNGLKRFYLSKGVNSNRILVAPDSVDLQDFDITISKELAREKLNLPKDAKIALYTGHLYEWKGAHILAQAVKFFPENTLAIFVGGTDKHIEDFKGKFGDIPAIRILGKKPYNLIPLYLKAADVLVLPNSPINDISSLFTSPMKLFEYMASGRPIIASDLLSIREVLSENNAVLVPPDDPEELARAVEKVLNNEELAMAISQTAYTDSKRYTWEDRANSVISFIKA